MSGSQDRNLPASAKKKSKARADGNVPRSRDLGHFVSVGLGAVLMMQMAVPFTDWLKRLLEAGLRFDHRHVQATGAMGERLVELAPRMLIVVVPLGVAMAFAAVVASVYCGGWNFAGKALRPNFGRMNPWSGLGRLVNKQHLLDTLKLCLLAACIGTAGGLYLHAHWGELVTTLSMSLPAALARVAHVLGTGLLLLVLMLFIAAVIDVPLQRWLWADRLKMSHQEVKEEFKQVEGNTEVKAKMKARMRALVRRRMLAAVPTADLVVMNPQHYAVALKYDESGAGAPRVVAKGADLLALRIKEIARAAGVPVLRAPPLARALYAHVELDHEIPAVLFAAVAQVLAFIYQLRRDPRAAAPLVEGMHDLSHIDVPPDLDPHRGPDGRPEADRTGREDA